MRWGRVDLSYDTLGRLSILTSYDNGRTKTGTARWMPVHPALRPMLNEWRLGGWARTFGRMPEPGDLVVPTPPEPRRKGRAREVGRMLDDSWLWKRAQKDYDMLGIRRRRVYDLRRTGISLYRADGADSLILNRGTHAPPRSVMELYTSVDWKVLCREVSKLRFGRRATNSAVSLLPGGKTSNESEDIFLEAAGIEPAALGHERAPLEPISRGEEASAAPTHSPPPASPRATSLLPGTTTPRRNK